MVSEFAGLGSTRVPLINFLSVCRSDWSPKDLRAVQRKLGAIGVRQVTDLVKLVNDETLNCRLDAFGEKRFSDETISAMKVTALQLASDCEDFIAAYAPQIPAAYANDGIEYDGHFDDSDFAPSFSSPSRLNPTMWWCQPDQAWASQFSQQQPQLRPSPPSTAPPTGSHNRKIHSTVCHESGGFSGYKTAPHDMRTPRPSTHDPAAPGRHTARMQASCSKPLQAWSNRLGTASSEPSADRSCDTLPRKARPHTSDATMHGGTLYGSVISRARTSPNSARQQLCRGLQNIEQTVAEARRRDREVARSLAAVQEDIARVTAKMSTARLRHHLRSERCVAAEEVHAETTPRCKPDPDKDERCSNKASPPTCGIRASTAPTCFGRRLRTGSNLRGGSGLGSHSCSAQTTSPFTAEPEAPPHDDNQKNPSRHASQDFNSRSCPSNPSTCGAVPTSTSPRRNRRTPTVLPKAMPENAGQDEPEHVPDDCKSYARDSKADCIEESDVAAIAAARRSVRVELSSVRDCREVDQKSMVKRLLVKWHPDRNPDRIKVATAIFQYIQQEKDCM